MHGAGDETLFSCKGKLVSALDSSTQRFTLHPDTTPGRKTTSGSLQQTNEVPSNDPQVGGINRDGQIQIAHLKSSNLSTLDPTLAPLTPTLAAAHYITADGAIVAPRKYGSGEMGVNLLARASAANGGVILDCKKEMKGNCRVDDDRTLRAAFSGCSEDRHAALCKKNATRYVIF